MANPAPAAVDALVALLRTAAVDGGPLAGVRVDDGPPPGEEFDEFDAIGVGVSVDEFEAIQSTPGYALGSEDEPADVQCTAQSWTGDADPEVWGRLRTRAFELLDVVRDQLTMHPDLGLPGVVWRAEVARWSLRQALTESGAPMAVVPFTVRINAYRRT